MKCVFIKHEGGEIRIPLTYLLKKKCCISQYLIFHFLEQENTAVRPAVL